MCFLEIESISLMIQLLYIFDSLMFFLSDRRYSNRTAENIDLYKLIYMVYELSFPSPWVPHSAALLAT